MNEKEVREDRGVPQVSGESGSALPEEFRAGLDEYFNRLERGPGVRVVDESRPELSGWYWAWPVWAGDYTKSTGIASATHSGGALA